MSEVSTEYLRIVRRGEYIRDGGQGHSRVSVSNRLEPNRFSEHAAAPLLERDNVPARNL